MGPDERLARPCQAGLIVVPDREPNCDLIEPPHAVLSRFADRPWSDGIAALGAMAQQPAAGSSPCASMVFTASDFPALAGGIKVWTSGDAVAQVW